MVRRFVWKKDACYQGLLKSEDVCQNQSKHTQMGAQVAEWLARRSLANAARVRFPAGDLILAL